MRPLDPRLLRHARATRPFLALSVALGVLTVGCAVAQASALAHAVAAVFLGGAALTDVQNDLAVLAGAVAVRMVVAWAQEVVAARASAVVKSELRTAVLRHVVALGPTWLAHQRTGDITALLTRGVDALDPYFARYLPQLVLTCVVPPLIVGWIWWADWLSGLVIVLTLPLIPFFMVLVGWTTERSTARQWRVLQRLSHHFLDVVDGLPTLRVFGRATAQERSIAAVTDDYRRATMKVLRISFLSAFVLELAAALSVALVAVEIGLRLVDGSLVLQTGLLVLILAPEAYLPLRQLGANYHAAAEGVAAAQAALDVLDLQPGDRTSARGAFHAFQPADREPVGGNEPVGGAPLGAHAPGGERIPAPPVGRHGLVVDGVSVVHPERGAVGLAPLSLSLRPGEVVALVGPSGVGKSTLVSVLLGFTPPTTGEARVADTVIASADRAGVDLAQWRKQVAWVPQRPALLAGTVAENVRLGAAAASDSDVRRALRLAAAEELDPDLRLGEDGSGLSAGQRQRVALARAFLRAERGAGLLLLDEPTSHLDTVTEERVVASVRALAAGRCVLVVVHRPALAATADRVVRLGRPRPLGRSDRVAQGALA